VVDVADKDKSEAKAAKQEKEKGKKTGKGGKAGKSGRAAGGGAAAGGGGEGAPGLSLAEHPRAVSGVARAKAWGALIGFLLGGYLSLPTHPLADAALRALVAGIVCYVAVWAAAVFAWRRLVVAELRHAQHEALATELAKLGISDRVASDGANQGPPARARVGA
jgi:hypothetical protein